MREVGFNKLEDSSDLKIKKIEYPASKGKEYFLEVVNEEDVLYGLLRLRIVPDSDTGIVRELHVYGKALDLHEKGKVSQHKGLGKWLMNEAENICREENCKNIKVISGVGVREYYKKVGYSLDKEGVYMEKNLYD